jgi:NADPH:quinone reductase-like Zn-dependent oxidoreductase
MPKEFNLSKHMQAARQHQAGGQLMIQQIEVPKPAKGEVLVKMLASPVNPSDLSLLSGTYAGKKHYPLTPGIEGSGIVVASGGGILANMRLGKTVACSSSDKGGTWAEYMVTTATKVIPVSKKTSAQQAAMLIVNPITALSFIDIAKNGKHKAIVNTAAASTLGQMLIKLCKQNDIELINIVRNKKHIEPLQKLGAKHIICTSENNWSESLRTLALQTQARLFFDAVAGANTSQLANAAPKGSSIVVYANLSESDINIDPRILMHNNITMKNFFLGNYTAEKSLIHNLIAAKKAQKLITQLPPNIVRKTYPLNDVNLAIEAYRTQMSGGKILLTIQNTD